MIDSRVRVLGRQEGRVETARTFVSTGPSFSSLLPLPLLGDLGRALHGPGWGTSGVSYVGGPVSHIVLRTSVCGIEQVSVCVCRGVSTGVGPCGWVFQRCREGGRCCGTVRCAGGGGYLLHRLRAWPIGALSKCWCSSSPPSQCPTNGNCLD